MLIALMQGAFAAASLGRRVGENIRAITQSAGARLLSFFDLQDESLHRHFSVKCMRSSVVEGLCCRSIASFHGG